MLKSEKKFYKSETIENKHFTAKIVYPLYLHISSKGKDVIDFYSFIAYFIP